MDKLLLYKVLKNKSGAEISASGNPATLPGTLKNNPMNEMKVFGWSKQDGDPTPENPVEIESAGMKWSTGKNLFSGFVFGGTSSRVENGIMTTKEGASYIRSDHIPCEVGKHYVYNIPKGWRGSQTVFCNSDKKYIGTPKLPQSFNVPEDTAYFAFQIAKKDTTPIYQADLDAVSKLVQVEQADVCTEYEPYTGGVPKLYSDKIGVTAHGKNLFDLEYVLKQENWNVIPGRYYYIPYYVGKGSTVTVSYDGKPALGLGAYVLVGKKAGETGNSYGWLYHSSVQSLVNNTKTFVAEADYIYINGAADYINMFRKHFKNFQIEVSPSPTAYEPYHEPQSLSIQTPTGLPAIPVGKGGNYTDTNGQQWIADYIDLKRGKYVRNICIYPVSGDEKFTFGSDAYVSGGSTDAFVTIDDIKRNSPAICNALTFVNYVWSIPGAVGFCTFQKQIHIRLSNNVIGVSDDATIYNKSEAYKTYIKALYDAGKPIVVHYILAEPIERDLTPSEIQAYQNLVTYAGTTIVENDADCYMEVSAGGGGTLRAKKLALILGD